MPAINRRFDACYKSAYRLARSSHTRARVLRRSLLDLAGFGGVSHNGPKGRLRGMSILSLAVCTRISNSKCKKSCHELAIRLRQSSSTSVLLSNTKRAEDQIEDVICRGLAGDRIKWPEAVV